MIDLERKARYSAFLYYFSVHQPDPKTELNYNSPFELLVAVMLSAQCTDKRINSVTPTLFLRFPDAHALSKASIEEVYNLIKSVSYPNSKAKHLVEMAKSLVANFDGKVPKSNEDLQSLAGVGRKTANVITSIIFEQPAIAVDTHVFRVAGRLGLTDAKNVLACELELTANIPSPLLRFAHHWLILHGRYICTARKPACPTCPLKSFCRFYSNLPALERAQ